MIEGTIDGQPYPISIGNRGQTLWETTDDPREPDEVWDDWSGGIGETKRETGRGYLFARGFDATKRGALSLSPFYHNLNNTALTTAYGYGMEDVETAGSTLTYDAASTGKVDGSTELTFSHTVGSNNDRLLLVGISTSITPTVTLVLYDGIALTAITGGTKNKFWYLLSPPSGAADIQISYFSIPSADIVAGATSWSGVNQDTPFGTMVQATGTDNAPTVTATTAAGEFVADLLGIDGTVTASVGADQTERWNDIQDSRRGAGSTQAGSDGGVMSWSLSGSPTSWGIKAIPIKPASTSSRSIMNISDTTKIFKHTYDGDGGITLDNTDTTASGIAGRPAKMNAKWYCPMGSGADAVRLDDASTPTWADAGWKADHLANYQKGIQPTLARVNSTTQNTVELNDDTSGNVGDTWTDESQEVGDVSTKVTDLVEVQGELMVAKEDSLYRFGSEGESFSVIPFLPRGKADPDNGKGMDAFGDEVTYPSSGNLWRHRIGGGSLPIGVNTIAAWRKISAIPTPKDGRHAFEIHAEAYRYTLLNDGEESHLLQRLGGSLVYNSVLTIPLSKGLALDSRMRLWIKGASTSAEDRDIRVIQLANDGSLDVEKRKGQASADHDIYFDERNPGRPQDKVQIRHYTVELEGDWDATTSLQLKLWLDNATTAVSVGSAITAAGVTIRNPTVGTDDEAYRFRPQLTVTTNSSYTPKSSDPQVLRVIVGIRFPEIIRIVIPADDTLLQEYGMTADDAEQKLRRLQNQGVVAFGSPGSVSTFNAEIFSVTDTMYQDDSGNYGHGIQLQLRRWVTA